MANRLFKAINRNKQAAAKSHGTTKAAALYDEEGRRVCADYEVIKDAAGREVLVFYDSFGMETGRELSGSRKLYEADINAVAVEDMTDEERAFLFNNLRPPKNASKAERPRFYQLQKVAAGINGGNK